MTAPTEEQERVARGPDERRVSPLAAWRTRFEKASRNPERLAIREVPWTTQINLRGQPADPAFLSATAKVLGVPPPAVANTWATGDDCTVLWLGPDEWLVCADDLRRAPLGEALRGALDGVHCALTDLSAARTVIELSGLHARPVLARGCPLDLHARAFAVPQCAQSLLAKAQIILQCLGDSPVLRLYVRASFADYLARWLTDAASEAQASYELDGARIAARLG